MASLKDSSNKVSAPLLCPSMYIPDAQPRGLSKLDDHKWHSDKIKADIYLSDEISLNDLTKLGQLNGHKKKSRTQRTVNIKNLRPHGIKDDALLVVDDCPELSEACDHVSLMAAPLYAHQYLDQLMQANCSLSKSKGASQSQQASDSRTFSSIAQDHIAQHSDLKKLSTCYGKRTLIHKVHLNASVCSKESSNAALYALADRPFEKANKSLVHSKTSSPKHELQYKMHDSNDASASCYTPLNSCDSVPMDALCLNTAPSVTEIAHTTKDGAHDIAASDNAVNEHYDFVFMAEELDLCNLNCLYLVRFSQGKAIKPSKPLNTNRTRPMRLTKLQMSLKIPRYTYAQCSIDGCSYTYEDVVLGLAIGELYSMLRSQRDYGYLYAQLEDLKLASYKPLPSALYAREHLAKQPTLTHYALTKHDDYKSKEPWQRSNQANRAIHRQGYSIYPLANARSLNESSLMSRYPYNGKLSLKELQLGSRRNVTFSFGQNNEVLISCIPLSAQACTKHQEHDLSSLNNLARSNYQSPLSLLAGHDLLSNTHYEIELTDGIAIQSQLFSAKAFDLQCSQYDRLGLAVTFGALKREHIARNLDDRLLEELKEHLSISAIAQYIIDTASTTARLNPDIFEAIFVKACELNYFSKLYGPRGAEYQIALFDDHIEIIKGHYYGLGSKYVTCIHGRYRGVTYIYQSNEFYPLHLLQGKAHVSKYDGSSLILNRIDDDYSTHDLQTCFKEIGSSFIHLKN